MQVLVIGTGGREHALTLALSRDPGVTALHAAPGNPGMAGICTLHDVDPLDGRAVAGLARELGADLVVIGRIGNYRVEPGGYERFDVAVADVLRGRVGRAVTVRYSGGMLGPPRSLPRRPVLIALRREGGAWAILSHICSDPFLLPAGSAQAIETRRLLAARRGRR